MVSCSLLFRTWLGLGLQSFGGGTTTLVLIRRSVTVQHDWLSDEEFNRNWALCQMTPGVNIIGLTVLIGYQLAGIGGIGVCLFGLLLPSAFMTAALTAGYLAIHSESWVVGALAGIVPATIGLGFVNACQMGWTPLKSSYAAGYWQLVFAVLLLVGSALLCLVQGTVRDRRPRAWRSFGRVGSPFSVSVAGEAGENLNPVTLFLFTLRAALLSSGGFGNVSSMHDSLIPRGWATDSQFVEALTVGQLSPGPNGLWVVSLGYLMLGPWGAVATLFGIILPPLLVVGVDRLYRKVQHHPAVEGMIQGLTLTVVGVFVPVLIKLLQASGVDGLKIALLLAAFGLGWLKRVPVIAILGGCGVIGVLASHA